MRVVCSDDVALRREVEELADVVVELRNALQASQRRVKALAAHKRSAELARARACKAAEELAHENQRLKRRLVRARSLRRADDGRRDVTSFCARAAKAAQAINVILDVNSNDVNEGADALGEHLEALARALQSAGAEARTGAIALDVERAKTNAIRTHVKTLLDCLEDKQDLSSEEDEESGNDEGVRLKSKSKSRNKTTKKKHPSSPRSRSLSPRPKAQLATPIDYDNVYRTIRRGRPSPEVRR